jgi:hypothetical protein
VNKEKKEEIIRKAYKAWGGSLTLEKVEIVEPESSIFRDSVKLYLKIENGKSFPVHAIKGELAAMRIEDGRLIIEYWVNRSFYKEVR